MEEKIIKSYKGFDKDMTCRGFQYEEGKEYETDKAEACKAGFHACEYPLDVFNYYSPNKSVFHEVEQGGDLSFHNKDSKVASKKIKIGAEIGIAGLVKAAIEYTVKRVNPEAKSNEEHGASSSTGTCGASSSTGDYGASSSTGDYGASSSTGDYGASSSTGYKGASSSTGYKGASSSTGTCGASSSTGTCGASSSTGYKGASSSGNPTAVAVAWGYKSKAKGVIGSYLVLADWEGDESKYNKPEYWNLKGANMVQVDGEIIKADTWYTMKNGEVVEVEE